MAGFFSHSEVAAGAKKPPNRLPKCGQCGNSKRSISPRLEPYGSGERRVLFVNENPGKSGARVGKHFAGETGDILQDALLSLGTDIDDCISSSSVRCGRDTSGGIEPYMVSCCRPNLMKVIKDLKPRVIVPLGNAPLESVLREDWGKATGGIDRWVGWSIPSNTHRAWICPTYHPLRILQMNEDKVLIKTFRGHIQNALEREKRKPTFHKLPDLESKVDIILNPRLAYKKLKWLNKQEGVLAFDYETTGLKPDRKKQRIVSVSFCLDGVDTWACMTEHPKVMEALKEVLQNPKLLKVASNLKFEERWTKAKLDTGVAGWHWDTMLVAHLLDNRSKITSVKFQAFVYLGIGDYDTHISPYLRANGNNSLNRIKELDPRDLLLYNGLDSLLEYMVMEEQQKLYFGEQYGDE